MEYEEHGFVSSLDGTRLFFGVRGRGPAIVLADGIGCAGFVWEHLQPILAKDYRVVHCHYRGHGRSGPPAGLGVGMETLAQDAVTVLDHLGVGDVAVFGHSMGTQVSLEICRRIPERVRGLGLLCGSYGRITQTFHGTKILDAIVPRALGLVSQRMKIARGLWGRIPPKAAFHFARVFREVDAFTLREEDFHRYWDHISLMDPDVFLRTLAAAGEHSAESFLPEIACPSLVVAAERDTFTPPELAQAMSERIPGADYLLLEGGSHAAPVEQPRRVAERVRTFLAERVYPNPVSVAPPTTA